MNWKEYLIYDPYASESGFIIGKRCSEAEINTLLAICAKYQVPDIYTQEFITPGKCFCGE